MPTADSGSLVRGQRDPGGQSEQRVTEHRGTAGSNDRRKLTRQPRLLLVVLIGSQRIDTGGLDVGQPLLDGCAQLGTGPDRVRGLLLRYFCEFLVADYVDVAAPVPVGDEG